MPDKVGRQALQRLTVPPCRRGDQHSTWLTAILSRIADSPKGGLMVIRQFADGATPLGLPREAVSELLELLDVHQSYESAREIAMQVWNNKTDGRDFSDPVVNAEREKFKLRFRAASELHLAAKKRRALLAHIKTIAETPAKNINDLLFKAYCRDYRGKANRSEQHQPFNR